MAKRFLTLVNYGTKPISGAGNQDGLLPLKLDCWSHTGKTGKVDGQEVPLYEHHGRLIVNSGQPYAQIFRDLPHEVSGQLEPIPEGRYTPGPLEFASGRWGDYSKDFPEVESPIWMVIHRLRAIGFHLDGNRLWAPGSAACPVFRDRQDMKTFVAWHQEDPWCMTSVWVDWWQVKEQNLPKGLLGQMRQLEAKWAER